MVAIAGYHLPASYDWGHGSRTQHMLKGWWYEMVLLIVNTLCQSAELLRRCPTKTTESCAEDMIVMKEASWNSRHLLKQNFQRKVYPLCLDPTMKMSL